MLFLGSLAAAVMLAFISLSGMYFQSEARSGLTQIAAEEVLYRDEHMAYSDSFSFITLSPAYMGRYIFFLSPTDHIGKSPQSLGLSLPLNFNALDAPTPGLTDDGGYVAVAIGHIDSDGRLDVWRMDESGQMVNCRDDVLTSDQVINTIKSAS